MRPPPQGAAGSRPSPRRIRCPVPIRDPRPPLRPTEARPHTAPPAGLRVGRILLRPAWEPERRHGRIRGGLGSSRGDADGGGRTDPRSLPPGARPVGGGPVAGGTARPDCRTCSRTTWHAVRTDVRAVVRRLRVFAGGPAATGRSTRERRSLLPTAVAGAQGCRSGSRLPACTPSAAVLPAGQRAPCVADTRSGHGSSGVSRRRDRAGRHRARTGRAPAAGRPRRRTRRAGRRDRASAARGRWEGRTGRAPAPPCGPPSPRWCAASRRRREAAA